MILKTLLKLCISLLLPVFLFASDEAELKTLMTEKADNLYAILQHPEYDKATRQQKVLAEVEHLFDFNLMARFALDTKTWKSLSQTQRHTFSDLFVSHIKESYLNKIDLFADTEVNVEKSEMVKKNRIYVTTILKSKTDSKEIIYKFYRSRTNKWLIYDVDVVGVSFLQSYRAQFASYLREHSFDELLQKLKNGDDANT